MNKPEDLSVGECSAGAVVVAFLAGAVVGVGAVLLLTPEGGLAVRRRLLRGVATAQEELTEVITETREAIEVLTKDARQTVKRTASRLKAAVDATSAAMKASAEEDHAKSRGTF